MRLTHSARKKAVLDGPNLDEKVNDCEDGKRNGGDGCLVLVVVDGDGKDHADDVEHENDDTRTNMAVDIGRFLSLVVSFDNCYITHFWSKSQEDLQTHVFSIFRSPSECLQKLTF